VIYANPPWRFEPYSRLTGMDRAAKNHYPTSPLAEIKALDVNAIGAVDCVLFLWRCSTTPSPKTCKRRRPECPQERSGLRSARRAPRLTESLPTSAFGTTPIGLFPRPRTADRRAASPRPRATSPPTQRPSFPNFGTPQSEPPTLRDIAAPNPATRSRACVASVSLGRGFVPLSHRRQARSMERY
jgi:hypothetical protein